MSVFERALNVNVHAWLVIPELQAMILQIMRSAFVDDETHRQIFVLLHRSTSDRPACLLRNCCYILQFL